MWVLPLAAESVALILGGLAMAMLLCWLLWKILIKLEYPELGPVILIAAGTLATLAHGPQNEFFRLVLALAVSGAVPFALESLAWRSDRGESR
jgi:hypothetical protein